MSCKNGRVAYWFVTPMASTLLSPIVQKQHFFPLSESAIGNSVAYSIGPHYQLGLSVDPTSANFEWFAQAGFAVAHASWLLVVAAEEIADVTSPQKVSEHWV